MTRQDATAEAQETATKNGIEIAVVKEGPHADEFAERDADGESYGFCPLPGVPILYKWGEIVWRVKP